MTVTEKIQAAADAAQSGADLESHSATALRGARKLIQKDWPVRRIIREYAAYTAVETALARIAEELNARELDNRLAPRAQYSRGFSI